MPTFIKEIGVSARKSSLTVLLHEHPSLLTLLVDTQLYSMIPYAFAIVSTLTMCYLSDRYDSKGYPIFVSQVAAMIGLLILLTTKSTLALMVGCCFVATGATSAIPISAAWLSTIHGGYTKKGTMFAVNQVSNNPQNPQTQLSKTLNGFYSDLYTMFRHHCNTDLQHPTSLLKRSRNCPRISCAFHGMYVHFVLSSESPEQEARPSSENIRREG